MLDKKNLDKKAAAVAKKFNLTDEEVATIQQAARGLYDYIGGDLPPERKDGTCSRATIIEVVLDAGRLESDLRESGRMTPAIAAAFAARRPNDMGDLIGPAFLYDRYEVSGEEVD